MRTIPEWEPVAAALCEANPELDDPRVTLEGVEPVATFSRMPPIYLAQIKGPATARHWGLLRRNGPGWDVLGIEPSRGAAFAEARDWVLLTVEKILRAREQRGTWDMRCPACGAALLFERFDEQGQAEWEPCPDHPRQRVIAPLIPLALQRQWLTAIHPAILPSDGQ